MQMESRSVEMVATPDEEREMKFPVMEQQPPSRNFTPLQMVVLFLQFCLVGIFLGSIITQESAPKDHAISPKYLVVTVERERKVGGGFKYRLVGGKTGGIEAIIMENLPSYERSKTNEPLDVIEQTTVPWISSSNPPLMITTQKLKIPNPPRQSIPNEVSMPSPPVPPPWSPQTTTGPLLRDATTKKQTTTRAPFKFHYGKDFFRG